MIQQMTEARSGKKKGETVKYAARVIEDKKEEERQQWQIGRWLEQAELTQDKKLGNLSHAERAGARWSALYASSAGFEGRSGNTQTWVAGSAATTSRSAGPGCLGKAAGRPRYSGSITEDFISVVELCETEHGQNRFQLVAGKPDRGVQDTAGATGGGRPSPESQKKSTAFETE